MYHDAHVQPVATVHRHPTTTTPTTAQSQQRTAAALTRDYELHRVVKFVLGDGGDDDAFAPRYVRVALQFPDALLGDAVAVLRALEQLLRADARYARWCSAAHTVHDAANNNSSSSSSHADDPHRPRTVRLFVLADNTFASCCPDEMTAQHYAADCLVHFGEACMSKSTRLPVLYVHPRFVFDTLAAPRPHASNNNSDDDDEHKDEAAQLVADVVAHVTATLRRWWRAHKRDDDKASSTDIDTTSVRLCLVIVGAYATLPLLRRAEQLVPPCSCSDDVSAAVQVEWCRAARDKDGGEDDEAVWVVNGVCVRRRTPSSPSSPSPLLLLCYLYVGPASTMACCHVLSMHYYNMQHYTSAQHALLQQLCDDTQLPSMAPLMALDEHASGSRHHRDNDDAAHNTCCTPSSLQCYVTPACVRADAMLRQRWRQRDYHVEALRASSAVGIVVATLAIQHYDEVTRLLHTLLRACGRRAYVLYMGHLNAYKLANFVDTVDCVVAVGCPNSRAVHFPCKADEFAKPVLTPVEVLMALCTADELHNSNSSSSSSNSDADESVPPHELPAAYTTTFAAVLAPLRAAVWHKTRATAAAAAATGAVVTTTMTSNAVHADDTHASGLMLVGGGSSSGGGALTTTTTRGAVVLAQSSGALARLHERHFVGLDACVGQTEVQTAVVDGKYGVARGYKSERAAQAPHGNDSDGGGDDDVTVSTP